MDEGEFEEKAEGEEEQSLFREHARSTQKYSAKTEGGSNWAKRVLFILQPSGSRLRETRNYG